MFGCVDVHYADQSATCALVLFDGWQAATPIQTFISKTGDLEQYQPGEFYKRELPSLITAIQMVAQLPDSILIDGNVWISNDIDNPKPGLGARLYEALQRRSVIIGIAKTRYAAGVGIEVFRGQSKNPLYVTAVGLDVNQAAQHVQDMHGKYRIPTIVRLTDQLARTS
ncbi:MAG: endonuclease V [Candidatus Obscuribacterales bacterium]|nr:endonuclease V [Candidatus Obscuribacterales bacterium]